ncbi:hypothetical protein Bra471DRAFT_06214 [Bradyrhizobium sp. WSM471]|nr:hypothetical protein Bra471DRAFT_06214 [Bradyrhizobium sp. WSM471]
MCRSSRLILEGRSRCRLDCEPGLRWTRQRRHEMVRAGRVVPVSPKTACGRAALLGFVSPVSFRLRRQGWKNCGEMAGRAYGKTVWSWPSLLRSSCRGGVCEPNRADSIIQIREAREARRKVRLPGEHGISRPTIAQGRPSDWHHLYAAVRFSCVCFSRSGPRVRGQHPAFPAPSWNRGWSDQANLGRISPRECESVSCGLQCVSEDCDAVRQMSFSFWNDAS